MTGAVDLGRRILSSVALTCAVLVVNGCGDGFAMYHYNGRLVSSSDKSPIVGARVAAQWCPDGVGKEWPNEWFEYYAVATNNDGSFDGKWIELFGPALPPFPSPYVKSVNLFVEHAGQKTIIQNVEVLPDQPMVRHARQLHLQAATLPTTD
jgi:hypothetical protein